MSSHFDMKDIGASNTILCIKLHRIENANAIFQTHCIDKVLNKFSHFHDKISHVLYNLSLKLGINKKSMCVTTRIFECYSKSNVCNALHTSKHSICCEQIE